MKSLYCTVVDENGIEHPEKLCVLKMDIKPYPFKMIKEHLVKTFLPDRAVDNVKLLIGDVEPDPNEKVRQYAPADELHIMLVASAVSPKRPRSSAPTTTLHDRVRKIISDGFKTYIEERSDNGLVKQRICFLFGHAKTKIHQLEFPAVSFNIVTEVMMPFALPSDASVVVAPYFTDAHVSLLCKLNNRRFIHLDASSSVSPNNFHLFEMLRKMKPEAYALTYVNYQTLDVYDSIQNLPGGNCSYFTVYMAIMCVVEHDRYFNRRWTFEDFWSRFTHVCAKTPDVKLICYRLLCNIFCVHKAKGVDVCCTNIESIMNSQDMRFSASLEVFKQLIPEKASIDFTADVMMLDLFIEYDKGFHEVNVIGNAIQVFLNDVVKRGFIAKRLKI